MNFDWILNLKTFIQKKKMFLKKREKFIMYHTLDDIPEIMRNFLTCDGSLLRLIRNNENLFRKGCPIIRDTCLII